MSAKTILLINIILVSLSAGQSALAQRGALWVHGLKDDSSQWAHWESLFSGQRHFFARNQLVDNANHYSSYGSRDGVIVMANNLRTGLNGYNSSTDNRSIFFGHSMGGVVGRDIDVNHTGDFGGIITAGSPLDGAHIANATRSGEAGYAISEGIGRVAAGPTREFGGAYFLVAGFAVDAVAALLFEVLDVFGLRDYGNQGGTDLQENSGYLTGPTRNAQTGTPKINIYGNEDGPTVWRLVSQSVGNGNDDQYVDVARTAGDIYELYMWVDYGIAFVDLLTLDFFGAIYFTFVADGWSQGMNWWRYDAERDWTHLIGADIPASKTISYESFDYQGFNDCMVIAGADWTEQEYTRCREQNTTTQYYTYYAPQNGQSDAFIKAPSQAGYNSNWSNNATRIEAQGVNHLEMKKHPNMEAIYNNIFDGSAGANSFFITPR